MASRCSASVAPPSQPRKRLERLISSVKQSKSLVLGHPKIHYASLVGRGASAHHSGVNSALFDPQGPAPLLACQAHVAIGCSKARGRRWRRKNNYMDAALVALCDSHDPAIIANLRYLSHHDSSMCLAVSTRARNSTRGPAEPCAIDRLVR